MASKGLKAKTNVRVDVLLPDVEQFHSLVSLDVNTSKSERLLGYPSWLYKAQSRSDGRYYCLRRLEGEARCPDKDSLH